MQDVIPRFVVAAGDFTAEPEGGRLSSEARRRLRTGDRAWDRTGGAMWVTSSPLPPNRRALPETRPRTTLRQHASSLPANQSTQLKIIPNSSAQKRKEESACLVLCTSVTYSAHRDVSNRDVSSHHVINIDHTDTCHSEPPPSPTATHPALHYPSPYNQKATLNPPRQI